MPSDNEASNSSVKIVLFCSGNKEVGVYEKSWHREASFTWSVNERYTADDRVCVPPVVLAAYGWTACSNRIKFNEQLLGFIVFTPEILMFLLPISLKSLQMARAVFQLQNLQYFHGTKIHCPEKAEKFHTPHILSIILLLECSRYSSVLEVQLLEFLCFQLEYTQCTPVL